MILVLCICGQFWFCTEFHLCFILSSFFQITLKGKGSPYSITERTVPELIPVLGSHPAGDVSHKPSSRLPLLSARPAVTPASLKRAATSFAAWWTEAWWVWTVCLRLLPNSITTVIWSRALLRLSPALGYQATQMTLSINKSKNTSFIYYYYLFWFLLLCTYYCRYQLHGLCTYIDFLVSVACVMHSSCFRTVRLGFCTCQS